MGLTWPQLQTKGVTSSISQFKVQCAGKTAERLQLTSPRVVDVPRGRRIPLLDYKKRASVTADNGNSDNGGRA